ERGETAAAPQHHRPRARAAASPAEPVPRLSRSGHYAASYGRLLIVRSSPSRSQAPRGAAGDLKGALAPLHRSTQACRFVEEYPLPSAEEHPLPPRGGTSLAPQGLARRLPRPG